MSAIRVPIVLLLLVVVAVTLSAGTAAQPPPHNVILVTLDGARVEEIFGGLDLDVLRSTVDRDERVEELPIYKRFWADDAQGRREKLMPFFWGTLMREHGSIAGNPARNSRVRLTNRYRVSYPGYSEMLVGRAQDDAIKGNAAIPNPSRTVLEFVRERLAVGPEKVGVFASWSVFNALAESRPNSVTVNAGFEPYQHPEAQIRELSALQFRTPTPWDSVRHDIYTARFALAHLAQHQPRLLYLALGETDDWAHDGRYDRVLEAYAHTDEILRELWTWLQTQPQYRGRTSLLITTDHGRGAGADGWRHHGAKYAGAEWTWMAFVSPMSAARGEWRDHAALETRQVAATLLQWLGLDGREFSKDAAPPIAMAERRQGVRR